MLTGKSEQLYRLARAHGGQNRCLLSLFLYHFYRFRPLRPFLRWMMYRLEGGMMNSDTLRDILEHQYKVKIGKYTYGPILKPGLLPPGTVIGNYCSFAPNVTVLRRNHPIDRISTHPLFYNKKMGLLTNDSIPVNEENPLLIGHDVWIGGNTIILPNCRHIGDGAVVGAGAVVTKDVAPYTIVVGNPARPIKKRFSESVEELVVNSNWFHSSIQELRECIDAFQNPASENSIRWLGAFLSSRKENHVN